MEICQRGTVLRTVVALARLSTPMTSVIVAIATHGLPIDLFHTDSVREAVGTIPPRLEATSRVSTPQRLNASCQFVLSLPILLGETSGLLLCVRLLQLRPICARPPALGSSHHLRIQIQPLHDIVAILARILNHVLPNAEGQFVRVRHLHDDSLRCPSLMLQTRRLRLRNPLMDGPVVRMRSQMARHTTLPLLLRHRNVAHFLRRLALI